jgi:hypothetical protein
MKRFEESASEDGTVLVAVPKGMLEALLEVRDEFSRMMDEQGKNLHGYDYVPRNVRYGALVRDAMTTALFDADSESTKGADHD